MEMYKKFIYYVQTLIEDETSLEQDEELLSSELNWNIKMAIVYRSDRKRIVRS